eukprot:TRINITY_DN1622_c0_g1_i1.p2 TRINITY_DN1622_c0_g1~~TRINITY_DN1622_c0_g1_i1.p2  ORF type:complete len:176 (+),score=56.17 TRINITY_DN1622_c0_g1_i1:33-530(+)
MYNGVGYLSVKGKGTSGYVQQNLAKNLRRPINFEDDSFSSKFDISSDDKILENVKMAKAFGIDPNKPLFQDDDENKIENVQNLSILKKKKRVKKRIKKHIKISEFKDRYPDLISNVENKNLQSEDTLKIPEKEKGEQKSGYKRDFEKEKLFSDELEPGQIILVKK